MTMEEIMRKSHPALTAEQIEEEVGQLPPGELAFRAVGMKKHYPGVKALDGVDLEGYAG